MGDATGPETVDRAIIGTERTVNGVSCPAAVVVAQTLTLYDFFATIIYLVQWQFPLLTNNTVNETEETGTIKYMKKGKSIWETHPIEKSRLIYQIGSADPELALQAAKIVEQDV